MKSNKNLIYIIAIAVVVGLITWGAVKVLKPAQNSGAVAANDQNGQADANGRPARQGGTRGNFKPLHGTIASVDTTTSTISMTADDGSNKNIATDSNTRISKTDNGQMATLSLSDLNSGDEINVMSSDATTSTIQARMIIIGTFTPPTRGSGSYGGGNYSQGPQDGSGYPGDDNSSSL